MAKATLHYKDYRPLVTNGKRDKAKRYINDAGDTISVREFQRGAHQQAGTSRQTKQPEQIKMQAFYRVVERLGKGETLSGAAKAEGISPATVRRINEEKTPSRTYNGKEIEGTARRMYSPMSRRDERTGRTIRAGFQVNASKEAPVLIIRPDGISEIRTIQVDKINMNVLGSYWNYAGQALQGAEGVTLDKFKGRVVYDTAGNAYPLITDVNTLEYAIMGLPEGEYEDLWNRFNSDKKVA